MMMYGFVMHLVVMDHMTVMDHLFVMHRMVDGTMLGHRNAGHGQEHYSG